MIKVFIPTSKGKIKSDVRGFWLNETDKIYYDYVKIHNYNQSISKGYYSNLFYNYLDTIKASYNQESIFIVNEAGQGIIYYSKNRQAILINKKIITHLGFRGLKGLIKTTLKDYKGLTIYQEARGVYTIEVYYND
jgi:hypothetical protein